MIRKKITGSLFLKPEVKQKLLFMLDKLKDVDLEKLNELLNQGIKKEVEVLSALISKDAKFAPKLEDFMRKQMGWARKENEKVSLSKEKCYQSSLIEKIEND